jgi:hypothetical protein
LIKTILIVLVCMVVAGPELGIGLELALLVDLYGVELFLLSFLSPLVFLRYQVQSWFAKIDAFHFVPTREQIGQCPALLAHAIPGYLVLLFWFAGITVIAS